MKVAAMKVAAMKVALVSCLILAFVQTCSAVGPPPAGMKVTAPWEFMMVFLLMGIDLINDIYQIVIFACSGEKMFAWFSGIVTGSTLIRQAMEWRQWSDGKRGCDSPWTALQKNCAAGSPTILLRNIVKYESQIEGPGTGLINIYGLVLNPKLSMLSCASAVMGFISSAKACAAGHIVGQAGSVTSARATRAEMNLEYHWYWTAWETYVRIAMASELALFSITSSVLHPIIPCLFYAVSALAAVLDIREDDIPELCLFLSAPLFPGTLFLPDAQSPFGVQFWAARRPTAKRLLAKLLRLVSLPLLSWYLVLPHGLLGWASFNREMGHDVLEAQFLLPTLASLASFEECVTSITSWSFADCHWPSAAGLTSGSVVFHTSLFMMACVFVLLDLVGCLGLLIFHKNYRDGSGGDGDQARYERCEAKEKEISDWIVERCDERRHLGVFDLVLVDLGVKPLPPPPLAQE